ncbi:uncharacterized protein LOC124466730 isoform X1 [Hypomesus transpacificus]|nr:uncharacterized protein LOC124466730 isoform X1 [Hypomesus transpacificus]XP_046874491.1 uncharacterized protein LOC124466730 isoform X1 [Hypomesus transpacificus]
MVCCAAWGCSNRSEQGVRMYGFPKDTERRAKWLTKTSRSNLPVTKDYNNTKICEAHFEEDQFLKTRKGKTKLRPDAVPTIFLHLPFEQRSPAPQCTVKPVKRMSIADEHSYSVKVPRIEERRDEETVRRKGESEVIEDLTSEASLLLPCSAPSPPTVLQQPSPDVISPKSPELQHNIDRCASTYFETCFSSYTSCNTPTMEDNQSHLSGNTVVIEADLRDDSFTKLVGDFLGPQSGEDLGLDEQPCKNRLLIQVGLMREDNQLSWAAVVEWLQKIFPMHQSADFHALIERGIATTLSLGTEARLTFLESNVNFDFVGPICDSIGVGRADLLEMKDFSERASSVEITNGLILELSNFVIREKVDSLMLVSWLRIFNPLFCRNGNVQKANKVLKPKLKEIRLQYRNYNTNRNRRNAMMGDFLQSPFELVSHDNGADSLSQRFGMNKRMKKDLLSTHKRKEPEVKIIKEESECIDIQPMVQVKEEEDLSSDEEPHVVQNSLDQVENPDEGKGEALTLLDIAMLSVQKLTSVYGGKTDASKQVSLDLLKNQYNLTCKENTAMKQFEDKITELKDYHSLISPLHFLHYNAHFLVDLHDAIEKELMSFENRITRSTGEKLGRDRNAKFKRFVSFSESATSRYVHMACDVLSPRAPVKQNYRRHWIAFCEEKNNPSQLAVNRSNRFNNYFEAAAGLIHHHGEISLFFSDLLLLDNDDCPNVVLESVAEDANDEVIQAFVCVLAIIYLKILGPYWQLLKSKAEYSLFSQYILCLYQKLLEWSKDPSPLLEPETIANVFLQVPLQEKSFDEVFTFCGFNSENVHLDLIRSCLQKMVRVIAAVTEENLREFLPGGEYCQKPSMELSSMLTTCTFYTLMGEYPFGHAYPYKRKRPDKITNLQSSSCYEDDKDSPCSSEDEFPSIYAGAQRIQKGNPLVSSPPTKRPRGKVIGIWKAKRNDLAHRKNLSTGEGSVGSQILAAVEKNGGPCKTKQDVDRLLSTLEGTRLFQKREAIRCQIGYQKCVVGCRDPSLHLVNFSLSNMISKLKNVLPDEGVNQADASDQAESYGDSNERQSVETSITTDGL